MKKFTWCVIRTWSLKNKMEMRPSLQVSVQDWHIRTEVQFCKWLPTECICGDLKIPISTEKWVRTFPIAWCYWRHFISIAIILWHLSIYLKYSCFIILNSVCNIVIIIWCFLHSGIFSLSLFPWCWIRGFLFWCIRTMKARQKVLKRETEWTS